MKDYLNYLLIFLIIAAISYLSLAPLNISLNRHTALLGHIGMYFVLAGALLTFFHDKKHGHADAVIIAGLTGLIMELLQSQLPHRSFDLLDIAVNFIGAGLIFLELKFPVVHRIVEFEERLIENMI